jgi:hypothetical protein
LTSRLALAEAKAISSKFVPKQRMEEDDEDENEELRRELKKMKMENGV